MIDVKSLVRKAYYELLNGSLSFNGVNVPVSDDLKKLQDSGANIYVLLSNQTSSNLDTMQTWDSQETIVLDIVHKAARSNKQTVDNIANQIFGLILPSPGVDSLIRQTGIHINCVNVGQDEYLTLTLGQSLTMTRRLITFRQHVRQTLDNTPMPGLKKIFPIGSSDFSTATDYDNIDLAGKTFQLFFNDVGRFLDFGTEWEYKTTGGFKILLPDFDATLNIYEFYVLLS